MGAAIAVAAISGISGFLLLATGLRRVGRAKVVSGGSGALIGAALLAAGGAAGLFSVNLATYGRLTYEQPVATVEFSRTGERSFNAVLTETGGAPAQFPLAGDAWQIDARILKFHSWANMAGLHAMYRLDRLSGRYDDVDQELSETRTVHALAENPGLDLWRLASERGRDLGAIDASYGSGTFVPMADGAVYEVSLSQTGLIARPANALAEKAVRDWR
ncbi:MAG: hypothetical protein MI723_09020 [Caulobacterales bacterium]|nr:hypothetical protein [Caulobacterales bacterium]